MIAAEGYPVQVACRVLGVSESGYYRWRTQPTSARALRHRWLTELITEIHAISRGTYGARRVRAELRLGRGVPVARQTVEMLMESMKEVGLLNPIHVYFDGEGVLDNAHLVCGRHRLEAARRLGWNWILGVEITADEIDRELVEIDENLIRAELSELDR